MNRLVAFGIFVLVFSGAYQTGSMYEHDIEEAQALLEEFLELILGIDGWGIFLHNLSLALPMFIPGFGAAWGIFSGWSTGFVLSAIMTASPALGGMHPLELLFLSPFGLMELAAYSLASSRSFLLILHIYRKQDLRPELRMTFLEVGVVVALLLAAGLIEYFMIEMALDAGLTIPEL